MNPRKILKNIIMVSVMVLFVFVLKGGYAYAATYYVSQSDGNDNNDGLSVSTPWKTLEKAGEMTYTSGDQLLLKCGDTWNEQLTLTGSGTASSPITLASYGTGNKPIISRNNTTTDKDIVISSPWGWKVKDLELGQAKTGIECIVSETGKSYLWFENLYIHDCTAGPYFRAGDNNRFGIKIDINNSSDLSAVSYRILQ